jgi:hypothetical protein
MWKTSLTAVLLLAASLACGSSNVGVQIGTQPPGDSGAAASAPPQAIYHVGDVIQLSDHTILLESAQFVGGQLQATFAAQNTGSEDVNLGSLLTFDARLMDGTQLEQDLFDCPGGQFDGKVLQGDRLRGTVCWTGVTGDAAKIYYTPNLFGSGATVWEVNR